MPIYEFVCADCGHEFESLQRLNEAPPAACPNCGKGSVSKKISAAGFRLKGGGWYETDFKNKNKNKGAGGSTGEKADAPAASDAGSTGSTGSDGGSAAKPAEKTSGSSE